MAYPKYSRMLYSSVIEGRRLIISIKNILSNEQIGRIAGDIGSSIILRSNNIGYVSKTIDISNLWMLTDWFTKFSYSSKVTHEVFFVNNEVLKEPL